MQNQNYHARDFFTRILMTTAMLNARQDLIEEIEGLSEPHNVVSTAPNGKIVISSQQASALLKIRSLIARLSHDPTLDADQD